MLLVAARVGPSAIHGLGLFAAEPIARGTAVWQFLPGFDLDLSPNQVADSPPLVRAFLDHYGYLDPRLNRMILCTDDARFLNHADEPLLLPDYETDAYYGIDRAVRDIAAGEEMTVDYQILEGERPG